MSEAFMRSEGSITGDLLSVLGHYPAPPGPDWGWRTVIDASKKDRLRILMFNISPEGQEDRAAEAEYVRQA